MTDQQPMLLASYDAGDCSLERLKRLGFTVFQYDTDHLSTDEAAPGVWDFGRNGWGGGGKYERIYERIRAQGGKWMLMTHFAWPPEWYRRTRRYTRLACLEHRQTCEAFSIWDPEASLPYRGLWGAARPLWQQPGGDLGFLRGRARGLRRGHVPRLLSDPSRP